MANVCWRSFCLAAVFAVAGVSAGGAEPSRADLSRKQAQVGEKRFQAEKKEFPTRSRLMERRFRAETWHGQFNSIGRRVAPIQVEEPHDKRTVRPEVWSMEPVNWRMARQNGQSAYVRNFDRVQDTPRVRRFEEAEVGAVRRERADVKVEDENFAMRDINRFSFQRNHSAEAGLPATKAGEGTAAGEREFIRPQQSP